MDSRPATAPSAVYRCTPQAHTRSRCSRPSVTASRAARAAGSLAGRVMARSEVVLQNGHEWAAGAARLDVRAGLVQRHYAVRAQISDRQGRGAVQAGVAVQVNALTGADELVQCRQCVA